jgi:iron complex outermembrane recepter protein
MTTRGVALGICINANRSSPRRRDRPFCGTGIEGIAAKPPTVGLTRAVSPTSLLCCLSLLAASALAQQPSVDNSQLEEIAVTGSNISGTNTESLLPVQVLRREDILHSGVTTTAELLATVPANFGGANDQLGVGNSTNPGLSSASLRGLGGGSTLVLLDGRRMANYAFDGDSVDLNSIPLAAIERVEILKDGSSAIYGSDAVAGVINFILRKDFQGFEADVEGDRTEHGAANQYLASLSMGAGSLAAEGVNVFATVSYQKDDSLAALDRSFARTGYLPEYGVYRLSGTSFPANIQVGSGSPPPFLNPTFAAGCTPPFAVPVSLPFLSSVPTCGYDFTSTLDIMPSVERLGALGRATLKLNSDSDLFVETTYSSNRFVFTNSPSPIFQNGTSDDEPVVYPADGPYYPSTFAAQNDISGDLNLRYRTALLGPRTNGTDTTALRVVLGAEGILDGWNYDSAVTYSDNQQTDSFLSGYVSQQRLLAALATGLINPFGESGAAGTALLEGSQITGEVHEGRGYTIDFDAKASGTVYALPAGPLTIAAGTEVREERLENIYAPVFTSGDVVGNGGTQQSVSGSRTAEALFLEASVPLLSSVASQFAARYDHYQIFGSTVNPKIALRWQPASEVSVRGSWGTGFQAPALYDLYTPLTLGQIFGAGLQDPLRCPITKLPEDCSGVFEAATGGNPNLQPEKSKQYDVGIVLKPGVKFSFTTDFWSITQRNIVGQIDQSALFGQFDRYDPTNIIRGPVEPAFPNLPGPIQTVLLTNQNLGNLRTTGFDVGITAGPWVSPIGALRLNLDATYLMQWEMESESAWYESSLGRYGPVPRWKHHAALDWNYKQWGATLVQTFQSGYFDANVDVDGAPLLVPPRSVGSYGLIDLQVRYTGFHRLTISLGIKNLLDRAPPFTNQPNSFQVGYDPTYADPRLRTFYARISYLH